MTTPVPTSYSPVRRRRFLIFLTVLVSFLFFFGAPWTLPPTLRDATLSALSRANIAHYAKGKPELVPPPKVDEIFGLLHLVTGDVDRMLNDIEDLDPSQPINMTIYAGDQKIDWVKKEQELNKRYPIVVFSKTYCPYSRRAKLLLETYSIQPTPKIIEVNLRTDADYVKSVLSRLTQHHTFPNILICGKTIGGFDDLHILHAQRVLPSMLEKAGAVVRDDGSGK